LMGASREDLTLCGRAEPLRVPEPMMVMGSGLKSNW
jgi:hypothetical protein